MNVQYQITEQDYINANSISIRNRKKNWHSIVWWSLLFFIIVILSATFNHHYPTQGYLLLIAIILCVGYAFFIGKQTIKFEYANNAFIKQPMNLTVNEEGCLFVGEFSQERVHWNHIYQYIESKQYWLIHLSPYLIHIVPKAGLSEEEQQQFSTILQQNIGERGKIDKTMK
ncbi:YcxB family protein [Pasteurella atlantica]|uniref:YcxB family protein n=1 Tax=Pasteurellaceae TaxID=712 RepID=UPI0027543EBD|nr:YcxB family protein [Pasteurella atlantica]MDP8033691.1 YcxB family protein [Pasteurella atlantica]MDP8035529.1 YcxB family protein [Pasteurella atlantica]MDP8037480.1 YcxB family protein [Pasteurella atlantica]MDP8047829.1 YcxB family protein [Pasteurella atlantica]MDP8049784.1 YcxB family protein [Pasteurella atlantica]